MTDKTSLDLLNDIVLSDPVPWWPPAPGWYALGAILAVVLLYLAVRFWSRWRSNRYRRSALRELAAIKSSEYPKSLEQLPALLKRAALSAWPRSVVAPLSGNQWHDFLDQSAGISVFGEGAGQTLDQLSYVSGASESLSAAELDQLLNGTEAWLRHHRSPPAES